MFLIDELPVCDQASLPNKAKMKCAVKYFYEDPKREIEDEKCLTLIYQEARLNAGDL